MRMWGNPSSLWGWLCLSLGRMLEHTDPGPHGWHPWEGTGLPKQVPSPAPALGSGSTFPASLVHCSAG